MEKSLPKFFDFNITNKEYYNFSKTKKIIRLGVKINTPLRCNWACPYCYTGDSNMTNRPGLFKKNEYNSFTDKQWFSKARNWLDQGIELGLKAITINGLFEPLTSPDFQRVINYCSKKNLHVILVTNGSFLKKELIEQLYTLNISILIKLNVPLVDKTNSHYTQFAEIQKKLAGYKRDATLFYENQRILLANLISAGYNKEYKTNTTRLGIESIISNLNINYIPDLVTFCRDNNIYTHIEILKDQGFAVNHSYLQASRKSIDTLFKNVLLNDIQKGYKSWSIHPPVLAGKCFQNLYRLDIYPDGEVRPCPGIDISLGNLKSQKMVEILDNDYLKIIRNLEEYIQGDCSSCDLFRDKLCYGGCRGTVFQELKKMNCSPYECLTGSDPFCIRVKIVLDSGLKVSNLNSLSNPIFD